MVDIQKKNPKKTLQFQHFSLQIFSVWTNSNTTADGLWYWDRLGWNQHLATQLAGERKVD